VGLSVAGFEDAQVEVVTEFDVAVVAEQPGGGIEELDAAKQWSWEFVSYALLAIFAFQQQIVTTAVIYQDVELGSETAAAVQLGYSAAIQLVLVPEQVVVDDVDVAAVIIAVDTIADFDLARTASDWLQIDLDSD